MMVMCLFKKNKIYLFGFKEILILLFVFFTQIIYASFILIPMDDVTQTNHLKAYGITYWSLQQGHTAKWLLNYEGGSFLLEDNETTRNECKIRGVHFT